MLLYYRLLDPITHIVIEKMSDLRIVGIWINSKFTGKLIVLEDELGEFLNILRERENPVVIKYFDGEKDCFIKEGIDDVCVVISEYGELQRLGIDIL